jgi:hypothetical protein
VHSTVGIQEAELAVAALQEWSGITVDEAMLMLSGSFTHPSVRERAVQVLQQKADDNKIYELMIQLVQCIKHDGQSDQAPLSGTTRLFTETCCAVSALHLKSSSQESLTHALASPVAST